MLRECGAVTTLAHPFEKKDACPDAPVDCIESVNARAYFKNRNANAQAEDLAASLGLPMVGGSDAHAAVEVGNAYSIVETTECSLAALKEAILAGHCHPVLVRNTPRRLKGLSQFRKALGSRKPARILKGVLYIAYCIFLDLLKGCK